MRFGTFVTQGWKLDLVGIPSRRNGITSSAPPRSSRPPVTTRCGSMTISIPTRVVAQESTFEAWTLMAALAVATTRVRLGQMCTCAGYRPPSLLAKIASSVDVISGGRLDVGIGAGWSAGEYRAYGYPFPSDRERLDMLKETVQVLKAMWTTDTARFFGEHYALDGAINRPRGIQHPHPPLRIAGGGEKRTLRIVAEHGDFANFSGHVETFRHKSSVLERHCLEVGRSYSAIGRSVHRMAVIGRDGADLAAKLAVAGRRRRCAPEEFAAEQLAVTVPEAVDLMGRYGEEGCSDMILYFYDMGEADSLELFASDVMSQLR